MTSPFFESAPLPPQLPRLTFEMPLRDVAVATGILTFAVQLRRPGLHREDTRPFRSGTVRPSVTFQRSQSSGPSNSHQNGETSGTSTLQLRSPSVVRLPTPKPYSGKSKVHRSRSPSVPRLPTPESDEDALTQLSDSSEDEDDEGLLIPKPAGEAGRPGRGGYNVADQVDWSSSDFAKLKKIINRLIDNHLDPHVSFTAQDQDAVQVVVNEATNRFPQLQRYKRCWPAVDLIWMRLKYTSTAMRRKKVEAVAGRKATRSKGKGKE